MALGGLFGALAVALPLIFHATQLGKVFLPMHLPVLALGMLVRPAVAGAVGVIVPPLSSLLTGMPPLAPPIAVMMSFELGALGAVASVLSRGLRWNMWLSAAGAIVVSKLVLGASVAALGPLLGFSASPVVYVWAAVITGLPGIVLQFLTVPWLTVWLRRAGVIDAFTA